MAADRATLRAGALALPLGIAVVLVSTLLHPSHEDPMDNPAVFLEYAQSDRWIAVHFGQYVGFLIVIAGLVALDGYLAIRPDAGAGRVWAWFGLAAAVTAAAAFTVLQAVDGIALKRAVDAWAMAPAEEQRAAFAAAEAVRWVEIGMNAYAFALVGASLVLCGLALVLAGGFPRWAGSLAIGAGAAYVIHGGAIVGYRGFAPSPPGLVSLVLFAMWSALMGWLMWRMSDDAGTAGVAATG